MISIHNDSIKLGLEQQEKMGQVHGRLCIMYFQVFYWNHNKIYLHISKIKCHMLLCVCDNLRH